MGKKATKRRKSSAKKDDDLDDKIIKSLEKKLRLKNKKKPSKSLPKSFVCDGLDYILEVCDEDTRKVAAESEKQLTVQSDDEFDIFTDNSDSDAPAETTVKKKAAPVKKVKKLTSKKSVQSNSESDSDSEIERDFENEKTTTSKKNKQHVKQQTETKCKNLKTTKVNNKALESSEDESEDSASFVDKSKKQGKRNLKDSKRNKVVPVKKQKVSCNYSEDETNVSDENLNSEEEEEEDYEEEEEKEDEKEQEEEEKDDDDNEAWEDIYGRKRSKDGKILTGQKYVSPALRSKNLENSSEKNEKLLQLRRQLKGLLNRLAESNIHSITSQVMFSSKYSYQLLKKNFFYFTFINYIYFF